MTSRFHEQAEIDLAESVEFYDRKSIGLGDRLVAEVRAAVRFIEQYTEACSVIDDGIRAKILVRFPHLLLYTMTEDAIVILAVAHQSQEPDNWRKTVRKRRPAI